VLVLLLQEDLLGRRKCYHPVERKGDVKGGEKAIFPPLAVH
jgi:hypothetical protein